MLLLRTSPAILRRFRGANIWVTELSSASQSSRHSYRIEFFDHDAQLAGILLSQSVTNQSANLPARHREQA
jgi:hypothetical protein